VSPTLTIARYVVQEAVRRKVFLVVLFLTALFLGLYALVNHYVFVEVDNLRLTVPADVHVEPRTFAGAFLLGLAMFATLFLGVVLAVFLTLSAVSGDAERGLLQPLVVRPIGRGAFLGARYLGAAAVCALYVLVVFLAAMVITGGIGHWWPNRIVEPSLELVAAVLVVTALSLLGSVFMSAVANGIAIFMLFGAGLVAGLLGTIGHALNSHAVKHAATIAAWALPFEALYQDALRQITLDASGLTGFLLQLGPFGGAYVHGWPIRAWTVAYLVAIAAAMVFAFRRRDL
jgi:ABC-2 type transport system permease protein